VPAELDAETALALQQLAARYWARTDGQTTEPIGDLFTVDARFQLGTLLLEGRAAIETFFRHRDAAQQQARRTTCHLATNMRLTATAPDRITVHSTVLVHAGIGELPLPSTAPAGIAWFTDVCVREPDGCWRFSQRDARPVFAGPDASSFARGPQDGTRNP
jgi:hypothetical protein